MLLIVVTLIFGLCCTSCQCQHDVALQDAVITAENEKFVIYLQTNEVEDDVPQVLLSRLNKVTQETDPLLLTHPSARMDWLTYERTETIHKDSIQTISNVIILSLGTEPLTLFLEGCSDYRNIESYIYIEGRDSVLCLPTNGRLLGIADEERALIMQSYDYYEDGGRYSVISAFDLRGRCLGTMNIKQIQQ